VNFLDLIQEKPKVDLKRSRESKIRWKAQKQGVFLGETIIIGCSCNLRILLFDFFDISVILLKNNVI
jgi:hypothetical protein